jgi:uncharacterized SAM-binding protein YcdF (DUF218 family)
MLYLVKFLYNTFLLPPGLFITALVVIAFYLYKREKKTAIALFFLSFIMYVLSTAAFANLIMRPLEHSIKPPTRINADVGAIVVLGGGATPDTPDIGGKGQLSDGSTARVFTAIRLQKSTGLPIIVSGGKVFNDSGDEANIAKRQICETGISPSMVIAENKSKTTEENAIFTSGLLRKKAIKKIVLVTSAYHMKRSIRCFQNSGVKVVPFPTGYLTSVKAKYNFNLFAPSYSGLSLTGIAMREYLGIIALSISP